MRTAFCDQAFTVAKGSAPGTLRESKNKLPRGVDRVASLWGVGGACFPSQPKLARAAEKAAVAAEEGA